MLKNSYGCNYEACNHVLINQRHQIVDSKGTTVKVLAMIDKWELMKKGLIELLGKVKLSCFFEEKMKLV